MAKRKPARKPKRKTSAVQVVVSPFALPASVMSKVSVKGKTTKLVLPQHTGQSFDNRVSHGNNPKWPIKSVRGGIHPSQVAAANDRLRRSGETNYEYAPDGDVVWQNRVGQRKYLRDSQQEDFSGYD